MHTMLALALLPFPPQLVEGRLGSDSGVWLHPAHAYGMDKLGNLSVLPFGRHETALWLKSQGQWQQLLLVSKVIHIILAECTESH